MDEVDLSPAEIARNKRLEREHAEMVGALNNPAILYFLWQCLKNCNVFSTLIPYENEERLIRIGLREHGLWLIKELAAYDPNIMLKLQQEADEREKLLELEEKLEKESDNT